MNFQDNIKEHQNKMKENIDYLQKETSIFESSSVDDIHLIFYMSSTKNWKISKK